MNRKLKKWGFGFGIYFTKDEIEELGYKEGDVIDISDIVKLNKKGGKNDKRKS